MQGCSNIYPTSNFPTLVCSSPRVSAKPRIPSQCRAISPTGKSENFPGNEVAILMKPALKYLELQEEENESMIILSSTKAYSIAIGYTNIR